MTTTPNLPSHKTIVLVGLVGTFLTSLAGITGSMLLAGWEASGAWPEWTRRLVCGYPCACLVVLTVFPLMVPRLTQALEAHWRRRT
jgi:hypothetical protein